MNQPKAKQGPAGRIGGAISFCGFVKEVLKINMTVGQRVIAKVCIDAKGLEDLDDAELTMARQLFKCGDEPFKIPRRSRRNICLRFGRGSGKSSFSSWVAVYKMFTADVSKCGAGDVPTVSILAPKKDTSKDVCLNMIRALIKETPALAKYVIKDDDNDAKIAIRRPDGKEVWAKAFAASSGGKTVRGRSIIMAIMDEAELFNSDPDGRFIVNDREMYGAITPRVIEGGCIMLISTPWPSENLMSEFMSNNLGKPDTALCAIAPTLLMRPDRPDLVDLVEIERRRDPENAAREYDCDASQMGKAGYFDSECISDAVNEFMDNAPNYRYPCIAAGDFGFKCDSSAMTIVQWDGKKYKLVMIDEMVPVKGRALKPSEVVKRFASNCKKYNVTLFVADGHYAESIREHLQDNGLMMIDAPTGVDGKIETYARAKACLHDGKIELPEHPRLLRQMSSVYLKISSGGLAVPRSPRNSGEGHGDIASAWVLAVNYLAYAHVAKEKFKRGQLYGQEYADMVRSTAAEKDKMIEERFDRAAVKMVRDAEKQSKWRHSN